MNRVFRVVWNPALGLWTVASEWARGLGKSSAQAPAVALALLGLAGSAAADCSGPSGGTITCTSGTPQTFIVIGGYDATPGGTVDVQPNAVISTMDLPAISMGDNGTILLQRNATVQNDAAAGATGHYGTGANTIEFRSNTTLTIDQGARVLSNGTAYDAEAINAHGSGNLIVNNGEVRSQAGGAAIWLEPSTGSNTIVNGATGVIEYKGGAGNILGVLGTMAVDFTNQGSLIGALNFASGDDALHIHTGSSITGAIDGGGGNNLLTLDGTGTDTFAHSLSNFQSLVKRDTGTWTFANALPGSGITSIRVAAGTLILGADASSYSGSMTVDAAGALQTSAQFAPLAITDNGLVRFAQGNNASYAGLLSGTGGIEKTGAGRLTLTRDQAITGVTTISAGTLELGNGGTTGMVGGPIIDNAALVVNRSNAVAFAAPISGSGSVTQLGSGTTTFTADHVYTGGTTIAAGTLQLGDGGTSGSVVGDIVDNAVLVANRSNTLALAGAISGSGALRQVGSGTTVLSGANSYGGATTVSAGTLKAGAANAFSAASAHSVSAGATLDTAGFDQRVAALNNAGTVTLLSTRAGSTLTVTGAYVGQGGVLNLGTVLGGSNSLSDRLVLSGPGASASGNTTLRIANLGGLGALTTGNGIEVVSALNGATTTAQTSRDAFVLANGHVDAGAYEYRLHAADAQGAGENWYLRSTTTVQPPAAPAAPATPADPADPGIPSDPFTTVKLPLMLPIALPTYRAEVPLFAALPAQLRQGDLAMLGNLHRRIGDEDAPVQGSDPAPRRAWARAIYSDLNIRQDGIAQAQSRGHVSGLQAGTDLLASGNWRAGLYLGFLDGSADVNGNARGTFGRVGANDLRSRYLGAYATWMDNSGLYADAIIQGGSHRYTVRPDGNPSAAGKGDSFTASIETGQAFALTERWTVEPQAQLIYQRAHFDAVPLAGAMVRQDADAGWIGRLGVRLKGDFATGAGRLQPYARVNLYRAGAGADIAEFVGPAGSTRFASASGYSAAEVAGGFTLALTQAASLYGELGRVFALGGDARVKSSVQGSAGVKLRW
ncbi:autotransporter outer membrane beta-barrel domain-containing protein [Variovorax soli]|uniref:Outer membrane autotransporter protein n=1 Tax=Variovorax soli TaxID=376815 RepID=A0ABU1NFJ7_9BURK|nr:autotransporter outer membrane beta-barrel domain-containing protein [Variovorax soli]MDR6537243.1 outer membrane autotransporter protein [Variovorax soli]